MVYWAGVVDRDTECPGVATNEAMSVRAVWERVDAKGQVYPLP